MTTARARHYPQPPPAAELLAAERCGHGEITGRCALCRSTDAPPGDQAAPPGSEPAPPSTRPRPTRRRVVRRAEDTPRPDDGKLW
jgi:hypothetical protein